jgi:hypothetical protein
MTETKTIQEIAAVVFQAALDQANERGGLWVVYDEFANQAWETAKAHGHDRTSANRCVAEFDRLVALWDYDRKRSM